nr:MAG TPA: hypothetical protein [Caudoviricetes sp.]
MTKPILFNTEMVKALLDGRKTVTRRVIKPQPKPEHPYPLGWVTDSTDNKNIGCFGWGQDEYGGVIDYAKPPCNTGDILYVRETWGIAGFNPESDEMFVEYKADGASANIVLPEEKFQKYYEGMSEAEPDWHPSIHMPHEAARIFLRVTDVRAERLQDITEEQAVKEGCVGLGVFDSTARHAFIDLWNSTLKKDSDCTWMHNPWVWAIEFERISKEGAYNA